MFDHIIMLLLVTGGAGNSVFFLEPQIGYDLFHPRLLAAPGRKRCTIQHVV